VSLAFSILAVLFALCAAACSGLRPIASTNKPLAKKYSLICASLAFIG